MTNYPHLRRSWSEDFIKRVANKTDKNKKERKAQIGFYEIRDPNTRYIGG